MRTPEELQAQLESNLKHESLATYQRLWYWAAQWKLLARQQGEALARLTAKPDKAEICQCIGWWTAKTEQGYPSGICEDCGRWYPGRKPR